MTGAAEPASGSPPPLGRLEPSPWVRSCLAWLDRPGVVIDVACGGGRHTRLALDAGHHVVAVDRDLAGLGALARHPRVDALELDLEADTEAAWALVVAAATAARTARVAAPLSVVVTNYLHRPLLPLLTATVDRGLFAYETFAEGNERFGRPTNPDFLLRKGELLLALQGTNLRVVAYEQRTMRDPRPAVVQHVGATSIVVEPPGGRSSVG